MNLSGKIQKIGTETIGKTAKGTEYRKIDVEISFEENGYSKMCAVTALNDNLKVVKHLKVGDNVNVHFNINSREFEGKYYTNLLVWRVDVIKAKTAEATEMAMTPAADADDLPF